MIRTVLLAIGTVLTLFFLFHLRRGRKYDDMVVDLDGGEFPLHSLYGAGMSMGRRGILQFHGTRAAEMKQDAMLLYPARYAEYYAMEHWSGAVTLAFLSLSLGFLLGGLIYPMALLMVGIGIIMAVYMAWTMLNEMKNTVEKRRRECETQLADVVSSLAILLNSGMVLHRAWEMVAKSGDGALYELMRKSCDNMSSGMSEKDAYMELGRKSDSTEIRKFTSAMLQSIDKGGSDLVFFLNSQSAQLWQTKRQNMLQQGERAATKLLVPILLIFVGIILIVIVSAFAGSMFGGLS